VPTAILLPKEISLYDFLDKNPQLTSFSIILEAKFSEVYHQKPNEIFYHATNKSVLQKILTIGLVPRSEGNFPERIYLGKNISEIKDMVQGNLNDMVILKVDVSNIKLFKLYRDQRNPTAVFTYDNIPPSQIQVLNTLV
jgi:RNA:NAD 2'-phosphotransferase (TPT1/KptA family)